MAAPVELRQAAIARHSSMIERLRELVETESPSDDPVALGRCADLLDGWFTALLGTPARRPVGELPHLLWAPPEPAVLVLGHFDTVWPLGTLTDMPFTLGESGVARGPGVFDMKAGIVQLLTALELIGDRGRVAVLLTCDEETGSATSRALIEAQAARVRAVLVCEPSADGGAVKIARKGTAAYRLAVTGRAAHAGLEPELGANAGVELAQQVLALDELARADTGTTVTPTVLAGGTTSNTVPASAHVVIDVRAWTRGELDRVDAALRTTTPRLAGTSLAVEGGINRYPLEADQAVGLLAIAQDAARDIGLPPPSGVRSGGGSDGNFTAALGIPTLDGLGAIGAHPHARSEWADADAMPDRSALLAALIELLLARPV